MDEQTIETSLYSAVITDHTDGKVLTVQLDAQSSVPLCFGIEDPDIGECSFAVSQAVLKQLFDWLRGAAAAQTGGAAPAIP